MIQREVFDAADSEEYLGPIGSKSNGEVVLLSPDTLLDGRQRALKRALDVVLSLAGLLILLPIALAIAMAVVLDSPGPVLYRGVRVGRDGKQFKILKFRSMVRDAEAVLATRSDLHDRYVGNGFKLEPDADPRLTRLGRLLRKTSLDEIPQFLNVLMGDMSMVGCRPVVPPELAEYGELQYAYLASKPGLTGHWQVTGRGKVQFPERAYLDLRNFERWSLWSDIKVVLKTIPAVFSRRGAY